ncbi:MAG TPA: DNA polymerase IV [Candidatus Polarisedimenticolia bacterium]|jgi:DNA polymerase-4
MRGEATSVRPECSPTAGRTRAQPVRRIIHLDMDAFFASVEQLDDPSLRGKPVAVGGDPTRRGVVAAASYEARAFGVRSAMPMSQAVRLCADLVCVRPRIGRYVDVSRRIRDVMRRWTPLVEMASLDEAYLDVSGAELPASEIALRLKAEIRAEVGLTASAGVGPSKLVAKIASDMRKPDGLVVVRPSQVLAFLAPLPAGRLPGVGPVTQGKLERLGIRTIGDLARFPEERLAARLGRMGGALVALASGRDNRAVVPARPTRSISCERTLPEDTRDVAALERILDRFSAEIESALREEGLRARTVVLKVRYSDFSDISRSRTLRTGFDGAAVIAREARLLLARTEAGRRKVRLVGVGVSGLAGSAEPFQQPLFPA